MVVKPNMGCNQGSVNGRFCDGARSETSQNVTVFMFLRRPRDDYKMIKQCFIIFDAVLALYGG